MAIEIVSTLDKHVLGLKSLQDRDKVLRLACVNGVSLILNRIQQIGQNSNLDKLKSYSDSYAKIRAKMGRQVSKTDLTMTGQMTSNFKVLPIGDNAYGLGFDNQFAAQKADWNEQRYGSVFSPSIREKEIIMEAIENAILKILNR